MFVSMENQTLTTKMLCGSISVVLVVGPISYTNILNENKPNCVSSSRQRVHTLMGRLLANIANMSWRIKHHRFRRKISWSKTRFDCLRYLMNTLQPNTFRGVRRLTRTFSTKQPVDSYDQLESGRMNLKSLKGNENLTFVENSDGAVSQTEYGTLGASTNR